MSASSTGTAFCRSARLVLDLQADPAGAEEYGVKVLRRFVRHGAERLFHADGRTTAVDVAGEGQKFLRFEHGERLFAHAGGGFLISPAPQPPAP